MKLWQKIFLPSVAFTMAGIFIISMSFVLRIHTLQLQAEKAAIIARSIQVAAELEQSIEGSKSSYFISSVSMEELLRELCPALSDEVTEVSVSLLGTSPSTPDYSRMIFSQEIGLLQFQRNAFIAGSICRISISKNIQPLLDRFQADVLAGQIYGVAASLAVSAALLLLSVAITSPIKKLKIATERIADGDYSYRIEYKGTDELSDLAGHMNNMAAHIEADSAFIENISESRRKFIANMTHELKTPLTSILGFADVLRIKADNTDNEIKEYADIIFAEANRLRMLSSRLMELLTVEEVELPLVSMNISTLLERGAKVYQPICEEAQLSLSLDLEPAIVRADESLFTTLIVNLLDNARKASNPGKSIYIRCKKRNGRAHIQVEDQGIGIPEDQIPHVTEAFYMIDKSRTRKAGGAGIGLALCKAIVIAHHGKLTIESKLHEGTKVTVSLPLYEGVEV